MKQSKQPSNSLLSLPRDVLSKILGHAGQTSREDVKNGILTCKELGKSAADFQVLSTLELRDIVRSPLLAVGKYTDLFQECLIHSNPSAHYIKGLLEYFLFNNPIEGLIHLKKAANAKLPVTESVYLYGIINLCIGEYELGKEYLDKLCWKNDKTIADQCWKNIKIAVHGIGIIRKPEYINSLWAMVPPYVCNLNDMENTCEKCYHYKQMIKFVYTI